MLLAYNDESIDLYGYGQESINRETTLINYQWNANEPSFLISKLHDDQLLDKSYFMNIMPT